VRHVTPHMEGCQRARILELKTIIVPLRSWNVWARSVGGSWPLAGEGHRQVARARPCGLGHLSARGSAYVVFVVGVVTCVVAVAART